MSQPARPRPAFLPSAAWRPVPATWECPYFPVYALPEATPRDHISGVFARAGLARICGLALVRIELLLDHSLRPRLLSRRLMLSLELHLAALADSDHRNILDAFHDAKIALRHSYSLPQFGWLVWDGRSLVRRLEFDFAVVPELPVWR
jgi:hypothetical protein